MALATNSTPGSIVLGGDLTGNANAPELRPSGVVPGTYTTANITVDAKGRVIAAENGVLPTASDTVKGAMYVGDGLEAEDGLLHLTYASTMVKGLMQVGSGLDVSAGVISATGPDATTTTKGTVIVGSGLDVASGVISLNMPDATTSTLGEVQVGAGLAVTAGVISLSAPDATAIAPGVVQVGSGLTVTSGVVSTNLPLATTSSKGIMQAGTGLSITSGILSATSSSIPDATTSTKGVVQIGTNINVTAGVISVADASGTTTKGVVKSANVANVAITSGVIDVGTNIAKIDSNNVTTRSMYLPTLTSIAPTPNLNDHSIVDASANTILAAFGSPSNGSTGNILNLCVVNQPRDSASFISTSTGTNSTNTTICWNGSIFLKLGTNDSTTYGCQFSSDGVTWTSGGTLPASANGWVGLAWNGSVFCAISFSNVATSPDGITWTSRTGGAGVGISSGGGLFVTATQYSSTVKTSSDGITWTARTLPAAVGQGPRIAWNGSVFCIIQQSSDQAYTSPDGITWTARTLPAVSGWMDIAASNSGFYAIGSSTVATTSSDGITWTARTLPAGTPRRIIWDSSSSKYWISVGAGYCQATEGSNAGSIVSYPAADLTVQGMASSTGAVVVVGSTYKMFYLVGISNNFPPSYKFSNLATAGYQQIECVIIGTTAYCTYK